MPAPIALQISDVLIQCCNMNSDVATRVIESWAYIEGDPTHIYHERGAYTGIIDFGEIRGANALYDLGHFNVENSASLPDLLTGYRQIATLPSDYQQRIELTSLLIAIRRLGRWARRRQPAAWQDNLDFIAIRRGLSRLG